MADICLFHVPGGNTPLNWFTLALGLYTTIITDVILGDLERHLKAPFIIRFLAANWIGAKSAAAVAAMGFDWDDHNTRVAVFGGFALFVAGINNNRLFLVHSGAIRNPFFQVVAAMALAAAGATAAALCPFPTRGVVPKVVVFRALFYTAVSTVPMVVSLRRHGAAFL